MQYIQCSKCSAQTPRGETYIYEEKPYCRTCLDNGVENEGISLDQVRREKDTTVCARCGADHGTEELRQLADIPLCEKCYNFTLHRPFPFWLRLAALGLFVLVAGSLMVNFKYFFAFYKIKQGQAFSEEQKWEQAYKAYEAAAQQVASNDELRDIAGLFKGYYLLQTGDAQAALEILSKVSNKYPDDENCKLIVLQLESSQAFDNKDYTLFYEKNKAIYDITPNAASAMAGLASAAACMYAMTADEKYKKEARNHLAQAVKYTNKEEEAAMLEFNARTEYRLQSREIISPEEYARRFPRGWKGAEKQ